jgi:hypothetical protein
MESIISRHLSVEVDYLIEVPAFAWYKSEWMNAVWIFVVCIWGLFSGLMFFSLYFVIVEILKLFPVNLLEVIFSGDTSAPSPVGWDPLTDPLLEAS